MTKKGKKSIKKPLNVILLGDPAAGKATHAKYLCKRFNMYDLDMGRELRKISKRGVRKKYNLKGTLDKGKLTPTKLVRKILHDKIMAVPHNKGILFNGTPKMLGEAKLVAKWLKQRKSSLPVVIYMSIPAEETVKRMTERKEDFKGKFGRRTDDTKGALKERVKYYRNNISYVVKFFQALYPFKKISSNAPVPKVRKILVKIITEHEKRIN